MLVSQLQLALGTNSSPLRPITLFVPEVQMHQIATRFPLQPGQLYANRALLGMNT